MSVFYTDAKTLSIVTYWFNKGFRVNTCIQVVNLNYVKKAIHSFFTVAPFEYTDVLFLFKMLSIPTWHLLLCPACFMDEKM